MTLMKMTRRAIVAGVFAATLPFTTAYAFEPENTECIAPANPGGGWDFTCRQVGKALQDLKLIPGSMQVTNLAGGGGGVAFAEVVNKRNEDNSLIAKGYFLLDSQFQWRSRQFMVGFGIQNLLNSEWKEAQFETESRLRNEPEPVTEIHFTPGTPFNLRGFVSYYF